LIYYDSSKHLDFPIIAKAFLKQKKKNIFYVQEGCHFETPATRTTNLKYPQLGKVRKNN